LVTIEEIAEVRRVLGEAIRGLESAPVWIERENFRQNFCSTMVMHYDASGCSDQPKLAKGAHAMQLKNRAVAAYTR